MVGLQLAPGEQDDALAPAVVQRLDQFDLRIRERVSQKRR